MGRCIWSVIAPPRILVPRRRSRQFGSPSHAYSFALAALSTSIAGPYSALGSRDPAINSRLRFMLCKRSTASLIRQYQRITCRRSMNAVAGGRNHSPATRGFVARARPSSGRAERISLGDSDWLAERGEFELPVPICEQTDDGIRLRFATSTTGTESP